MTAPINTTTLSHNYRPDIDGLRAVAVLSVVIFHAFPDEAWLPGGFVGVDVFFVISGYLISKILFSEIEQHRFSLAGFYGRRIRRIFPALAVSLTAVLAYAFVVLMPSELAQVGKQVFFGANFLSNFALWSESGYFDSAATSKPLLHLWSLGIEEQFYILWPPLLWIAFKLKAPIGRLIVGLLMASFAINIVLSLTDTSSDFYLPVSRFWELLAGAALAWRRDIALSAGLKRVMSLTGIAAVLVSVRFFTSDTRFPGWFALLPVAGSVAIILAGPNAFVNRTVLSSRVAVSIGLISYPLYLWHWPLIAFSYVIRGKPPTALMALGIVVASLLLAWATYHFIERPVRHNSKRLRCTSIAGVSVAVLGACGLAVWVTGGVPQRFSASLDLDKMNAATLDATYGPTNGMNVLEYNNRGYSLVAQIGQGARKVALAGNSAMFHYGPRLQQLADEGRLAVRAYFVTGPACPLVPGVIADDIYAYCANVANRLLELVQREKVQTIVLAPHYWPRKNAFIERGGKSVPLDGGEEGRRAFYANLEDYVRELSLNATVYLVLGAPQSPTVLNPQRMVTRGVTGIRVDPNADKSVPIADLRAVYVQHDDDLRAVAERTGAKLLDVFPDVCGKGETCSPFFGAREPKFTDGTHLRPVFVREHLHFLDFLLM
ncbi:acyltransferase [Bradyrhizobium sp. 183]|uniref:acyltransferase family protein n=1 Tax=unclassified Bradyrhizobium TaxID=2631580 RepID=UPI001FFFCFF6|nr:MULTISPECIES: acyltransferase family protein [unclassified Bradyrhizobium]UPJ78574.1 acyltransferase [Bradyrhizobium sp. 184]UPJ86369.1 acyltransferase [Bradyrhizobium sp. 183]